jgi:hypothetical protein
MAVSVNQKVASRGAAHATVPKKQLMWLIRIKLRSHETKEDRWDQIFLRDGLGA